MPGGGEWVGEGGERVRVTEVVSEGRWWAREVVGEEGERW